MDSCSPCPAGYQCANTVYDGVDGTDPANYYLGTAAESKVVCGANHYCTEGLNYRTACPDGYYTGKTTAFLQSECVVCPSGINCGCTTATDSTAEGTICELEITDCEQGYYCPDVVTQGTSTRTREDCGVGYYCPTGTPVRIPCKPGFYCDELNQIAHDASKVCQQGYVCTGGSIQANPTTAV